MEDKEMKHIFLIIVLVVIQNDFLVLGQNLSIANLKRQANSLEIEIFFKNSGSQDVYLVSPNPSSKYETTYFIIPEDETQTLKIRRYFYSFPSNVLDAPEPCYGLIKVKAGEGYKENLTLGYSSANSNYFTKANVNVSAFHWISFQIGVLPYDVFIGNIAVSRPFGNCGEAQDKISGGQYSGKRLIDVQKILKTNTIQISY